MNGLKKINYICYYLFTMSTISLTKLYDLPTAKVGREAAENLTSYIEDKIKEEVESKAQMLATKEDIAKLDTKISESKVDVIKWVFAFWITLALMIVGLYLRK